MRQQRHARRDAEAAHLFGRQQRDLGHLLGRRVGIHVRVADEQLAPGQQQHLHRGEGLRAGPQADHVAHVAQVVGVAAEGAAQHRVGLALAHQHRAEQGAAAAHLGARQRARDAAAPRELVVGLARVAVHRRVELVDAFAVAVQRQPQAVLRNALGDDLRPADQQRPGDAFVDHHLRRAQHALVFAFGVDDALGRTLGGSEHRLHRATRLVDELAQALAIGLQVGDRPRRDAAVHGRLARRPAPRPRSGADRRASGSGTRRRSAGRRRRRPAPPLPESRHAPARRWRARRRASSPR